MAENNDGGRPHQPRRAQTRTRRTARPDTHRATTRPSVGIRSYTVEEFDEAQAYADQTGGQVDRLPLVMNSVSAALPPSQRSVAAESVVAALPRG